MIVRILGIGNPLRGDDGLGPAVVAALAEQDLPPGVEAIDAGQVGLGLVGLMEGADRVVIVDTAEMDEAPGTWRVFGVEEVLRGAQDPEASIHEARAAVALHLARALDCLPPEVFVVGVQPEQMEWESGLSCTVREVLPEVIREVERLAGAG